ncbi:MAG: hypothetical protein IJM25_05630 [Eubacterium sp.]|nr:hypothetical protein [Eubacterium sp.]
MHVFFPDWFTDYTKDRPVVVAKATNVEGRESDDCSANITHIYGLATKDKLLVDCQYEDACMVEGVDTGYYAFQKDGKWAFFNAKGDLQSEQEKTASLQSQLNEQSNNAAKVGEVYNRIDQLDEPDGTYYANRNVVVMNKGEGVSLAVHFSHTSSCKISYKGSNADVCTGEWSDSWFDNNNSIYLNLRAGYTTGYSILTFSNNINSSTFQVVVFVID